MAKAVLKKSPTRSTSRRVTPRKSKASPARSAPPSPPQPPPPPPVTEAERRLALAEALLATRQRLWGGPGAVLAKVQDVTLHGASVKRGRPHWHLLTEGLGQQGFELSLRVQREKEDVAPPAWAVSVLSTLVTRAFEGELSADTNQVMLLAQGVAPGTDSELTGVLFTPEPEQSIVEMPRETLPLLLAVPVTKEEARAVREWSPSGLVEVLAKVDPLLITWLDRQSLLQSPRARALIEQRMDKEGSSLSTMTAATSGLAKKGDAVTWTLSADAVDTLCSLLKGRIGHQRPFSVVCGDTRVEVVNGDPAGAELQGRQLTLKLTLVAARQLRSLLKGRPGTYTFDALRNFALTVV